jgi:hypothetical protein
MLENEPKMASKYPFLELNGQLFLLEKKQLLLKMFSRNQSFLILLEFISKIPLTV